MLRHVTLLVGAAMLVAAVASVRAAVPTFNTTKSSVTYSHDYQILDGPADSVMVLDGVGIPFGNPGPVFTSSNAPDLPNSSTTAGVGHTEQLTGVGMTVNAGGLVLDQNDIGDTIPFSVLEIDADLWWDVATGNFGLPLTGGFNLPLFLDVPPAGSAEVAYDIHWNARIGGVDYPDIRTALVSTCMIPGPFLGLTSAPCPAEPNKLMTGLPSFPPQIPLDVGPADLNADGMVNMSDVGIVTGNFGQTSSGEANGDTTGDSFVGGDDLDVVLANFGIEPNRINVSVKLTFRVNAASSARVKIQPNAEVFIGVNAPRSVNYFEDFNSGFTDGPLDGQNGWTSNTGFTVFSNLSNGGAMGTPGVLGPAAPENPGFAEVAHRQLLESPGILHVSWASTVRDNQDALVALSDPAGRKFLMGVEAIGTDANLRLGPDIDFGAFTFVDDESFFFEVEWDTLADLAVIRVTDLNSGMLKAIFSPTGPTGFDPKGLTHIGFRCGGIGMQGAFVRYDNLRLSTPEPTTLALIALGVLQGLRRRRRDQAKSQLKNV